MACDNTRTCRAAGYQSDDERHAISVLLTRKAGPGQAVTGRVMLGAYDDEASHLLARLPDPLLLSMSIDDAPLGTIRVAKQSQVGELSSAQVAALVASLLRRSAIEFPPDGPPGIFPVRAPRPSC